MASSAKSDLTAGVCAGAANILVGFPFDTLKVRLQAERGVYRSAWHCLLHIIRYEGLSRGVYRGLSPPLIGGALETGINYFVFRQTLNLLRNASDDMNTYSMPEVAIAGATAGFFLSPVLGPFELIKCRMQVAKGAQFRSPLSCLRMTLAQEGWKGLTRGMGATMIREVPGNSIFFTGYELLRRYLPGRPEERGRLRSFSEIIADATSAIICGGLAGILMWAIVLPLDVSKTRLQSSFPGEKYDKRISRQLVLVRSPPPTAWLPFGVCSCGKRVVVGHCILDLGPPWYVPSHLMLLNGSCGRLSLTNCFGWNIDLRR